MSQVIRSPTTEYSVIERLGGTDTYSTYRVLEVGANHESFMKIAPDRSGNVALDREALTLREIREQLDLRAAADEKAAAEGGLSFKWCFPKLEESFISEQQGNRRINIFSYASAPAVQDLYPLELWRTKRRERLDPKTGAWIMGRLFKAFTLTHIAGIEQGMIHGGNILINQERHHAAFFDWSKARHHAGHVPSEVRRAEIAYAARSVILALGGDTYTGVLPDHPDLEDDQFAQLLKHFADRKVADVFVAMDRYYTLVKDMWEKSFHPFTTIPLR